jgi:hypothetical protein
MPVAIGKHILRHMLLLEAPEDQRPAVMADCLAGWTDLGSGGLAGFGFGMSIALAFSNVFECLSINM